MTEPLAPEYVTARAALLDALAALEDHRDAIIVAGAQAVYLRAGTSEFLAGLQPYTTDADLALDPSSLGDRPGLEEAMNAAGFDLQHPRGDHSIEPGIWVRADAPESLVTVDLIVPDGLADPTGRRGARLSGHGKRAARKIRGLEAAVVDWSIEEIAALDPADDRRLEAKVAGTAALLVAKVHKIQDRLQDMNRLNDKDAADVYRLMSSTTPTGLATTLRELLAETRAAVVTEEAIAGLRALFGSEAAPGVQMGVRALTNVVPTETAVATYVAFTSAVMEALRHVR